MTSLTRLPLLLAPGVAAASLLAGPAAVAQSGDLPATAAPTQRTVVAGGWRITAYDLGTLGGTTARPYDVNAAGVIAGVAEGADGIDRPVFGRVGRGLSAIPGAGNATRPTDLSDRGDIAGTVAWGFDSLAVFWSRGVQTHPDPGATTGAGVEVDTDRVGFYNRLQRVGCGSNCQVTVPVECRTLDLATPGATSQPIPAPPGGWVDRHGCTDVSRGGTILGVVGPLLNRSFVVRNGTVTLLPATARDREVRASGITDAEDILAQVVFNLPTVTTSRALRLVGDTWQELPLPPGASESDGTEITPGEHAGNARHDLIGQFSPGPSVIRRPMVWRGGTTPVLLPDTGRGYANAINDRGDVVGQVSSGDFDPSRAALWRGGRRIDLAAALGAATTWSTANWITNAGLVVGIRQVNNNTRIVAWRVTPA